MIACEKLADILVSYCVDVREKELVVVNSTTTALPLVEQIYVKILQAGGYPKINLGFQNQKELFYENAIHHQLEYISPMEIAEAEKVDKIIAIRSQENTVLKSFYKEEKIRAKFTQLLNEKSKHARWVLTLFPTNAYAQSAGMTLREFEKFYTESLFLNFQSPVEKWKKIGTEQEEFMKFFKNATNIHLKSDLIDLQFDIKGRIFINSDGKQNMPSGEIYTSPVENSVNGYFSSTVPNTKYGSEIMGVKLEFKDGKVVKFSAEKGEELLGELLNRDHGAKFVGEFGIGCNYGIRRYIKNILFDEKIGGTIHIALGQGYEKVGGVNKSSVHLDLISEMKKNKGEIEVDGETVYKNGNFLN